MSTDEWSLYYDHGSSSWRTRQQSLLAGLDEFSGTWPDYGTMRNGRVYRLDCLVPPIDATAFLCLPGRPVVVSGESQQMGVDPFIGEVVYLNGDSVDVVTPDGYTDCFPVEWLTWLPTPTSRDEKGTSAASWREGNPTPDTLPDCMAMIAKIPSSVCVVAQPTFVESAMGLPTGWTDLDA